MYRLFLGLLLAVGIAQPAVAENRVWLGKARLFTNDKLGDGKDRWRSGSYAISGIRGPRWTGQLPSKLGGLMQYRIRSEIIAPANLKNPAIGTDRRYVGVLALAAISHFQAGPAEAALGLEMVFTGPQTGVGRFQSAVHTALGIGKPQVLGSQIGNAVYPTVNLELGRDFDLLGGGSGRVTFRPFIEAQAGVETYLRLGGDFTFGQLGRGDLMVRNPVTGFRNVALKASRPRSTSFLLGGDMAYIGSSRYLPAASGYTPVSPRLRLRAGIYGENAAASIFYGLTWLGREFSNQPESQVVGSVTVRFDF